MRLSQCDVLTAKKDFAFKVNGKGRTITVRAGQRFWVTTSRTALCVLIDRMGKGSCSSGYSFSDEQLDELFTLDEIPEDCKL